MTGMMETCWKNVRIFSAISTTISLLESKKMQQHKRKKKRGKKRGVGGKREKEEEMDSPITKRRCHEIIKEAEIDANGGNRLAMAIMARHRTKSILHNKKKSRNKKPE